MKRLKKPTTAILMAVILLSNSQGLVVNALEHNIQNNEKQKEEGNTITVIDRKELKNKIKEQNIFYNQQKTASERPYVTNIGKSVVSIGSSYYANISLAGQAKKGSTVYIKLGSQVASQYIDDSQSFGFNIETRSKNITVELYAVNEKGEQSDSVYVNLTSDGDTITNNGIPLKTNTLPIINVEDITIALNSEFDPLKDVSASDKEDGDLTKELRVTKNTVDTSKEGEYLVVYQVVDSDENISIKERKVRVEKPVINKPEEEIKFSDISYHWAENNIKDFASKGYINGYSDGTFRPQDNIRRGEFVKILNKAFRLTNKSGKVFDDTVNHWAKDEIDIAVTNKVCQGISDTLFNPDAYITREQAAVMIANYKKITDKNHDKISGYNDSSQVSNWATNQVEAILEAGYMNGYGDKTFKPKNNITRAEAVVTLERVLTNS